MPSPDQRGSRAAASRKSRNAIALVVCDGPTGTITGATSGLVRYCAAWQIAQVWVMRSNPTVFLENPTGNSRPSSQGMPNAA